LVATERIFLENGTRKSDSLGQTLDMGTAFDYFGRAAGSGATVFGN